MPLPARISHAGIIVRDVENQICFYERVFGFTLNVRRRLPREMCRALTGMDEADIEVVFMDSPEAPRSLEFLKYHSGHIEEDPTPPNRVHANHVCFEVDDSVTTNGLIVENGGRLLSEPLTNPTGEILINYARDPEGTLIEVIQFL
jgi:predicted enzyme related to lactoylglutathione lyase